MPPEARREVASYGGAHLVRDRVRDRVGVRVGVRVRVKGEGRRAKGAG